jgi:hypothetical protein
MRVRARMLAPCVAVVCALVGRAACAQKADPQADNTAATIDGVAITKPQFDAYTERMWSGRIIRDMIVDRLIWKEAQRLKVTVTPEEVAKAVVREKSNYASDAEFERALLQEGLSPEAYRARLHRDLVLQKLRERDANVTRADVRRYYDTHASEFAAGTKARVSELVFDSLEEAYAARERADTPAQFVAVGAEFTAKGTARSRELGWVVEGAVESQPLREALQSLKPNDVSLPVEDDTGRAHLLLLHERQPRPAVSFEHAADGIRQKLLDERMLPEEAYIRALIRRATVSVKWESCAWVQGFFDDARRARVIVDGRELGASVRPLEVGGGAVLVPAKPLLTAIGAGLTWDPGTQSLRASRGAHWAAVSVGSTTARIDGEARKLRLPPRMVDGNLYVEPRLVLEALGAGVHWDARDHALKVVSHAPRLPTEPPAQPQEPKAEAP